MGYVTQKGLQAVKTYKYDGSDKSLLANYVMQPFWRWAVNLLPLWMAPNLVTLIGFIFIIISYLLTAWFHPNVLGGGAPSWVYFFNAAVMFIYQTMDALDGKQARRTNTSSPLGELFDHGCDAVTTFLQVLTLASTLQAPPVLLMAASVSLLIAFYFTQWEEYHTGKLVLGYIGVTEAQIASIVIYLLAGIYGLGFWDNIIEVGGFRVRYGAAPVLLTIASSSLTIISNIVEVYKHTNSKVVNPGQPIEKFTFLESLAGVFSITLLSLVFVSWAIFSPNNVYINHPHIFVLTYGFLVANLVGRIVLHRVCHEPFPVIQRLLFPLVVVPISLVTGWAFSEEGYLYSYCIVSIGAYLHFAVSIIFALCKALKIRCFHVPSSKPRAQ